MGAGGGPEMLCGVGAPRPPGFGAGEEVGGGGAGAVDQGGAAEQADVGCRESVHLADGTEGDVLRGPLADAADGAEAGDGFIDGPEGAEEVGVGDGGFGECLQGGLARGGHAEAEGLCGGDAFGGGEDVGEGGMGTLRGGDGFAVERDELTGETAGGDDGDLLAEDGADGEFEAVPSSGGAQAGALGDEGSEQRVVGEMRVDGLDVGADVEHAADTGDDGGERFDVGEVDGDAEALVLGEVGDGDGAGGSIERDGAAIGGLLDDFDAGDGAGAEVGEHRLPIVGRAVAEAEGDAGVGCGSCGGLAAEGAGRAVEEVVEGFVEAAEAAESGGQRDFGHGHAGFVDELLGEEDAAGLGDRDGRGAEMLVEEAAELALAEAEAGGEGFDGGGRAVEGAVGDEGECAGDGIRSAAPGGELGCGLGPAAEAGTEAGFLRGGCGGEEAAVLRPGGAGGTDGAAIDAGGGDADEDQAVETGVPALECAIADFLCGEFHGRILSLVGGENSRFSDMVI